jgi:hypothetical protein
VWRREPSQTGVPNGLLGRIRATTPPTADGHADRHAGWGFGGDAPSRRALCAEALSYSSARNHGLRSRATAVPSRVRSFAARTAFRIVTLVAPRAGATQRDQTVRGIVHIRRLRDVREPFSAP